MSSHSPSDLVSLLAAAAPGSHARVCFIGASQTGVRDPPVVRVLAKWGRGGKIHDVQHKEENQTLIRHLAVLYQAASIAAESDEEPDAECLDQLSPRG